MNRLELAHALENLLVETGCGTSDECEPIVLRAMSLIESHTRAAVERERERCAKVAEEWIVLNRIGQLSTQHQDRNGMARAIAAVIREARKAQP